MVHLAGRHDFADLDDFMKRFKIDCFVIDGLLETHATRAFAEKHSGQTFRSFFNEHQRGEA